MAGTPMISANWPRFILPLIRKEWYLALTAVPSPAASLFNFQTSNAAEEYSHGIGGLGLVQKYNSSSAEGQPASIQYDSFNDLHEKTFPLEEYALGIAIERFLIRTEQQGKIIRRAQSLGHSFGNTIASFQSSIFVNAFSTTNSAGDATVGGDGVELCTASHPNRPDDTGTLRDNYSTAALSHGAVADVVQAGLDTLDDRGNPFPVTYDLLYVPTALAETASRIARSDKVSGEFSNDDNRFQGLNFVVDPRLSDANDWFMISTAMARMHLLWYWLDIPSVALDPSSDFNLVAKYRGYFACAYGWDEWRWVHGSEVS